MSNSYFIREYDTLTNKTLKISQIEIGDVSGIVWDAAIVLGKYLEKEIVENRIPVKDGNIIELGAGTGFIELILATYG
jgi:protein N-lysine methyltransferase METTL21D